MSIRKRILVSMLILTIGSSAAVLISSIFLYKRDLNNAALEKVNLSAAAVRHELNNLKSRAYLSALSMSNNQDIIRALLENDREKMGTTALALLSMAQLDFCTILDSNGVVLTRTHQPDRFGNSLAALSHVSAALSGRTETYFVQGHLIRLGAAAGTPIFDDDKNIIGAVSLGFRLDSQRVVSYLNEITGSEISVFLNGERIATTLRTNGGIYAIGTNIEDDIYRKVLSGETVIGRFDVFGRRMLGRYFPLLGSENEVVGMLFVGNFTEQDDNKVFIFIINGIMLTIFVLAVCVIFARIISVSIERQLKNMEEQRNKAILEKEALSNLTNILNGLDAMIYVTDPQTSKLLFINEQMKKHFNIQEDPIGKSCYKILQKDREKKCEFCPSFWLENEPDKIITWEEHNDLTNRTYRNIDRFIDWPNGKVVHMQYSVDITDVITAKEIAEQSSRYKSAFLATMSHEIRTPMNAILGITEIQLRDKNLPPHMEEALGKIYESSNLLLHIINDILDLSKIEAGKLELTYVKYDISSLINDTVQLNLLRFESKPIEFKLDVDENTPLELIGDEMRIKQVLNNILSNAYKYTENGEIVLSVSAKDCRFDDVTLVFTVKDTGQGMTGEQIDKLYDEYTRFNLEVNRTTLGTGLGMNITKRLVSLMNGNIIVESEYGKGTVFTVCLPQKRFGTALCGSELTERLRNFSFKSTSINKRTHFLREYMPYGKVLVVDDVESNIYVAKGMLLPYGLKVDTAVSGFKAIDLIKNGQEYDIIFMDHMMPKMDGIETTKKIRELGYKKPVVALTANAIVGQAGIFIENGFDGFISKPIDSRDLNVLLNELIRNKKPQEVVEKARRQHENEIKNNVKEADIEKFFIHDGENALRALNKIQEMRYEFNNENLNTFIITVHGIKSALINIGEMPLFNTALKLEDAAKGKNLEFIKEKTPAFLTSLETLLEKIKAKVSLQNSTDILKQDTSKQDILMQGILMPEDQAFLMEKLSAIKAACTVMDKKTAKAILSGLKEKTWPPSVNWIFDKLTTELLHSDFERITAIIDTVDFK